VGFLGLNGAGKTTTLRILAGYLPATSGAASVAGFDVLRQSMQVRERIGYLPESVPLYREHRVEEMLEFQGRLHGMSRDDRKRRIPEVLERVGVADRARQLVGTLSRGLRQRVGLAVALLPDPEVLILDEPTSGLDPLQRIEVRDLVRELASEHTVLFSSHILAEVEAVCRRVLILHRGRLVAEGTPAALRERAGAGPEAVLVEGTAPARDAAAALAALRPGLAALVLRETEPFRARVTGAADPALRASVARLFADRGWALTDLRREAPSLEEVFARLTIGEDA
jgi:ABC-2 type transport system ATP-binding protein